MLTAEAGMSSLTSAPLPLPDEVKALVRPNILALEPYRCARDDYEEGILLDANENSLGPPMDVSDRPQFGGCGGTDLSDPSGAVGTGVTGPHLGTTVDLERYPDPHQAKLKALLANLRGTRPNQIAVGNGSDELIDLVMRIFCQPASPDHILTCPPTYGMYKVTAKVNDVGVVEVPLLPDSFQIDVEAVLGKCTAHTKLMFLCSPGNPTARMLDPNDILRILESPSFTGMIVVDEAYVDFAISSGDTSEESRQSFCRFVSAQDKHPRVIVMQTLSKAWGLAGIRLGMLFAHEAVAQIINNVKAPYNVNKLTSRVARQAVANGRSRLSENIAGIRLERVKVSKALSAFDFVEKVYPSDSNFVLFKLKSTVDALKVYRDIAAAGVVIRYRGTQMHCENCLRATIGTAEENSAMLAKLEAVAS